MIVKVINSGECPIPEYKTPGAAGVDLMANIEKPVVILPFERCLIPTGLFMEIPVGFEAQIRPRSGLAINSGISLVNCVGTIDSDYRGEIKVPLINLSSESYTVNSGDRIAQMVFASYVRGNLETVTRLQETERGSGGFGSTGLNDVDK